MTIFDLVVNRMKSGAKLVVVGDKHEDDNGNITCDKIGKLYIVTPSGAEITLPSDLFADLCPELSPGQFKENFTVEYGLRGI